MDTAKVTRFGAFERELSKFARRTEDACQSFAGGSLEAILSKEDRASPIRFISVDVFDTMLLRNGKSEARRLHELAGWLHRESAGSASRRLTVEDFYVARNAAMNVCHRASDSAERCRNCRIDQVLRTQAAMLGFDRSVWVRWLSIELDYEQRNLSSNHALVSILREWRANGKRVLLLADTYLRAEDISKLGEAVVGDMSFVDEVISSADVGLTKGSGKIFGHLAHRLAAEPGDFLHVGDDIERDVRRAMTAGWRAIHFPVSYVELCDRQLDLEQFLGEMDSRALDVRRFAFAKVSQ